VGDLTERVGEGGVIFTTEFPVVGNCINRGKFRKGHYG